MNKRQKREFYERIKVLALPEHFKELIYAALRDVLAPKPSKTIRRVRTASPLMTLPVWEVKNGTLVYHMLRAWAMRKKLCPRTVEELIEEFRTEMLSKNKEYADFTAAFQTYLNKGYLSKQLPQVLWVNSPYRTQEGVTKMQAGAAI